MWEDISDKDGRFTARLSVPGGWLVRVTMTSAYSCGVAIAFVHDEKHEWQLEEQV